MLRWLWPPKCFAKKSIYATGHVGTFSRMVFAVVLIVGELLVNCWWWWSDSPQAQLQSIKIIKRALQKANDSETHKTGETGEAAQVKDQRLRLQLGKTSTVGKIKACCTRMTFVAWTADREVALVPDGPWWSLALELPEARGARGVRNERIHSSHLNNNAIGYWPFRHHQGESNCLQTQPHRVRRSYFAWPLVFLPPQRHISISGGRLPTFQGIFPWLNWAKTAARIPDKGRSFGRMPHIAKSMQCLFNQDISSSTPPCTWHHVGFPLRLCFQVGWSFSIWRCNDFVHGPRENIGPKVQTRKSSVCRQGQIFLWALGAVAP